MDFDLIFVIGVALVAFSIPSLVSAYADRRWPKTAALMLLIAGGAIAYAMQENPDVYSISTIDETIVNVMGRYLN
jgi:FtsH-binding integral membrane protein